MDPGHALEFLLESYPEHDYIYADGSYNETNLVAGIGFYVPRTNTRFGARIFEAFSFLACEIYAICHMLRFIRENKSRQVVILTDSLRGINRILKSGMRKKRGCFSK